MDILDLYLSDDELILIEERNKIGDIVQRFKPGTSLSLNCSGNWVVERHDGENWRVMIGDKPELAGLFPTALEALTELDKPEKV